MLKFLVLSLPLIFVVQAKHLPNFVTKCGRADPNFTECVLKAVEVLRPRLAKGIPEMSIQALEPFYIQQVHLEQGQKNSRFTSDFRDIYLYGLSNFKISDLKLENDPNSFNFTAKLVFDKINLDSQYKLDAQILLVPIKGDGKFKANITQVDADIEMKFNIMKKEREILKLDKILVHLKFHKGNVLRFENLLQENKIIAEATDRLLVENDDVVLEEITPTLESVIEELILKITAPMEKYSVQELFLN